MVIRGNSLDDTGGDGIIVSSTYGALMEYNTISRANQRGTSANAGMWPHNSDYAVMQYNEVYGTRYSGDGMGFDIDQLCNHCISHYNLGSGGYAYAPGSTALFDFNCFYGTHPANEPEDNHRITSDPMLMDPGTVATGRNSAERYQLRPGSPCLSSGKIIPDNGGRDFQGYPVPSDRPPGIGAFAIRRD